MVGQLVKLTICDGREQRFVEGSDTNTETEHFTTTEDDEDSAATTELLYGNSKFKSSLEVLLGAAY